MIQLLSRKIHGYAKLVLHLLCIYNAFQAIFLIAKIVYEFEAYDSLINLVAPFHLFYLWTVGCQFRLLSPSFC